MKRACENCEWWVDIDAIKWGTCHGLPPLRDADGRLMHPLTQRDDWCGFFRASEAKIREAG